MITLESQTFNINRMLLHFLGLWFYRRSFLSRIQLIILFSILITYIIFQFTVLMTRRTSEIVIQVVSSITFFMITATKYILFLINGDFLKTLLMRLQNVCDKLKDKEIAIIHKYGYKGKRYTYAIIFFGGYGEFLFILGQVWPYIPRLFIYSVNTSLHVQEFFVTEYFIDQEKYYYLIKLHLYAAWCIGAFSLVATGSYLLTYSQHICGLFSIASYRIEQALIINVPKQSVLKSKDHICTEIKHAIDIHREAVDLIFGIFNRFESLFFCLIIFGTIGLVSNLLIIMTSTEIQQLLPSGTFLLYQYIYLFIANYIAQQITDHNDYVFVTVYNVEWYLAPVQIQKMMLFLLQKGAKPLYLIIGGILVACMETAASIMKMSISYCTIIYSTLQIT